MCVQSKLNNPILSLILYIYLNAINSNLCGKCIVQYKIRVVKVSERAFTVQVNAGRAKASLTTNECKQSIFSSLCTTSFVSFYKRNSLKKRNQIHETPVSNVLCVSGSFGSMCNSYSVVRVGFLAVGKLDS